MTDAILQKSGQVVAGQAQTGQVKTTQAQAPIMPDINIVENETVPSEVAGLPEIKEEEALIHTSLGSMGNENLSEGVGGGPLSYTGKPAQGVGVQQQSVSVREVKPQVPTQKPQSLLNKVSPELSQQGNVNKKNNISQPVAQAVSPVVTTASSAVTGNQTSAVKQVKSEVQQDELSSENLKPVEKKKDFNEKLELLQNSILSANIPQMVLVIISYALDLESSDIHIEPLENHVRIRYRVDGVLRHIVEYPTNLHPAVISRIKIMSDLKIDEQRIPQDGRAEVTTKDGREMDLRVSTLPTVNGEKIVMRIQDKSQEIPSFNELGITGISLKYLQGALHNPNGIIINTGPTGSGKTTTLYACLTKVNKVGVNILTIEDPVEIQLDGLNQSQVHHDIDYDFAKGMRAALRQDPDIIMVGEIRDKETADVAIEASLTGHLVFSTLHTNSAVESITRLVNMGVPHYLITSSVELIIAQRLVRRVCTHCKRPVETSEDMLDVVRHALDSLYVEGEVDKTLVEKMQFFEAPGCEKCNHTGYKGRVGLYEVFKMNNMIRRMISSGASTVELQDAAQQNGMVTLEQSGIIKALEGVTTLEEVYRVARKSE